MHWKQESSDYLVLKFSLRLTAVINTFPSNTVSLQLLNYFSGTLINQCAPECQRSSLLDLVFVKHNYLISFISIYCPRFYVRKLSKSYAHSGKSSLGIPTPVLKLCAQQVCVFIINCNSSRLINVSTVGLTPPPYWVTVSY